MTGTGPDIVVARDPEELSRRAAEAVTRWVSDRAEGASRISIVLAGGATPRGLYRRLSEVDPKETVPWKRVHLFWGDERCVPPDDPESNYRLAFEHLISKLEIPSGNVHRMEGEDPDPLRAADRYERVLRNFFGPSEPAPRFDLVLLGVGSDGHTASLFPESSALEETGRWVAAPFVKRLGTHRLTLTLPALNHSRRVFFLAAGSEKAGVLAALSRPAGPGEEYPFRRVRPIDGRLIFFLDRAAAARLPLSGGSLHCED